MCHLPDVPCAADCQTDTLFTIIIRHTMTTLPNLSEQTVTINTIAKAINSANLNDDILVFEGATVETHRNVFPMRLEGLTIMVCNGGSGKITIDLREYEFTTDSIMVIQPKNFIQLVELSADFKASFLMCSLHIIEDIIPKLTDLLPILIHHRTEPVTHLSKEDADSLRDYYKFLSQQLAGKPSPFLKKKVICLLQAALFEMMEIQTRRSDTLSLKKSRKEEIMAKFILAVSEDFRKERQVSYYADKLCITPKHLSSVVKEISGRTAGDWIENYVLMEAKVLLKTTDLTIQQIAMNLNFSNQSFFGKYFKHLTGQSPTEFRKTN